MKKQILLLGFILTMLLNSCEEDPNNPLNVEYTVSGNVSSVEKNPAGYTLKFYYYFNSGIIKDIEELGTTIIDSNGNFKFSYKSARHASDALDIYLYDKNGKSIENFLGNRYAENWTKDFNFSKYALVEVTFNTDNPLKEGDTLFFANNQLEVYTYPFPNDTKIVYTLGNYGQLLAWARLRKNLNPSNWSSTNYYPKGAPHVDQIMVKY